MGDGKVANWAAEQLGSNLKKPFFLSIGFRKPHAPWHVPRKYFEMYTPDSITLPQTREDDLEDVPEIAVELASDFKRQQEIIDAGELGNTLQGYLASVSFVDPMIGRFLDALYSSPYAEDTIVVLWSDHGFHLGEKECWSKGTLWEESTRVPFIVSVPGLTEPGARCSRPVSLLDIYPTLIDLCGLTARDELEGTSIRPLLQDPDTPWERPAITTLRQDAHSVRSERWRYIRYQDGSEELYDHENDEHEWTNLASDPQYAPVKDELARWLPEVSAPDAPKRSLIDKVESRIKALIYSIDMDQD
jgi:arylsulfatase A-like enzyme